MKSQTVLFCPPTFSFEAETSLMAMIARLIGSSSHGVQLQCNGAFLNCDRDVKLGFHRTVESCLQCMSESSQLAQWAGLSIENLTRYMPSSDLERTKRWVSAVEREELTIAEFDGITPYEWCQALFTERFKVAFPQIDNQQHENFIRRSLLTIVRMRIAVRRFLFAVKPDCIFASPSREAFSRALMESAQDIGLNLISVSRAPSQRLIEIERWVDGTKINTDLFMHDYRQIKSELDKWPDELKEQLKVIAQFAGITVAESSQTLRLSKAVHG